jgi:hypothetical protein
MRVLYAKQRSSDEDQDKDFQKNSEIKQRLYSTPWCRLMLNKPLNGGDGHVIGDGGGNQSESITVAMSFY